jgi:hypothetical protein
MQRKPFVARVICGDFVRLRAGTLRGDRIEIALNVLRDKEAMAGGPLELTPALSVR